MGTICFRRLINITGESGVTGQDYEGKWLNWAEVGVTGEKPSGEKLG